MYVSGENYSLPLFARVDVGAVAVAPVGTVTSGLTTAEVQALIELHAGAANVHHTPPAPPAPGLTTTEVQALIDSAISGIPTPETPTATVQLYELSVNTRSGDGLATSDVETYLSATGDFLFFADTSVLGMQEVGGFARLRDIKISIPTGGTLTSVYNVNVEQGSDQDVTSDFDLVTGTSTDYIWDVPNSVSQRKFYILVRVDVGLAESVGGVGGGGLTESEVQALIDASGGGGTQYTLPAATASTRGGVKAVTNAIIDASTSTGIFGWAISHVKRIVTAIVPAWARDATTLIPANKLGNAPVSGVPTVLSSSADAAARGIEELVGPLRGELVIDVERFQGLSSRALQGFPRLSVTTPVSPVNYLMSTSMRRFGSSGVSFVHFKNPLATYGTDVNWVWRNRVRIILGTTEFPIPCVVLRYDYTSGLPDIGITQSASREWEYFLAESSSSSERFYFNLHLPAPYFRPDYAINPQQPTQTPPGFPVSSAFMVCRLPSYATGLDLTLFRVKYSFPPNTSFTSTPILPENRESHEIDPTHQRYQSAHIVTSAGQADRYKSTGLNIDSDGGDF